MVGLLNGHPYSDVRWGYPVPQYRPRRRTFATATTVAFTCMAIIVAVLFWVGHTSMQRMQRAMQSPLLEQPPPGWALTHKTTTLQSATVTISKGETAITGSALTATTTTTTGAAAEQSNSLHSTNQQAAAAAAAAGVAAAAVNAAGVSGLPDITNDHQKASFGSILGDLQQGMHALLTSGWKPGSKLTRAQLAAAAAASMQDEGRDIELHPSKVADVVNRAKAQQQLQALTKQPLSNTAGAAVAAEATNTAQEHSAEAYASLYGQGAGTVLFSPHANLSTCPEGTASPGSAAAAVVLLAGSSVQALKRSMDSLVMLYSKASPDIRAALHIYVGLDSDDAEMRQVAQSYALDTMGMVKLVHHSSNEEHASSNQKYDQQQQEKAGTAVGQADTNAAATPGGRNVSARRQLLKQPTAGKSQEQQPARQVPQQKVQSQDKAVGHSSQQQGQQPQPQPQLSASPAQPPPRPRQHGRPWVTSRVRSGHLRLMLHVFLECFKYPAIVLLEDDLKPAPDLLDFFAATSWLLSSDNVNTYCISAWNPLGHRQLRVHPHRLLRTDTHPGKAWMISREVGLQLLRNWPSTVHSSSTSDWLTYVTHHDAKAGRQCIVPEMPRVVPADDRDTSDAAHIHDPLADGSKIITRTPATHLGGTAPLRKAANKTPLAGGAPVLPPATAASRDEGSVDLEAYLAEDGGSEGDYSQQAPNKLDKTADGQQQQQPNLVLPAAGAATSAAANASAAAAGAAAKQMGWMDRDLSLLLDANYRVYIQQTLVSAERCDVATAAKLADPHGTCIVLYRSGPYLSATAERLGIPLAEPRDTKYCVLLPAPPGASELYEMCENWMVEMAYDTVVMGSNRYGARVILVHQVYFNALQDAIIEGLKQLKDTGQQEGAPAAQQA